MAKEKDMDYGEWETDSGLLTDYDATIIAAEFTVDEAYAGGEMPILRLEFDHASEATPAFVSIGAGWEIENRGGSVSHPTKSLFVNTSTLGRWINRCVKELGMYELLSGKGGPTTAATWEGLRFHFEMEEVDFGKNLGVREILMPTDFLGEAGDEKGKGKTKTKTKTKDAEVDEEEESGGPLSDFDAKTRLALKKLVKKADNAEVFQEEAVGAGLDEDVLIVLLDDDEAEAIFLALS